MLACYPTRPVDFTQRIEAVNAFKALPEAESLAAANKRIRNILKKVDGKVAEKIDEAVLEEAAEKVEEKAPPKKKKKTSDTVTPIGGTASEH